MKIVSKEGGKAVKAFSVLLLAFAVSLDSFIVGATYGMRQIHIPVRSILIIAACSSAMVLMTMLAGEQLAQWVPLEWGKRLGAMILCLVGAWSLWNVRRSGLTDEPSSVQSERELAARRKEEQVKPVWTLEIRHLGLVVQVLKKPVIADMDQSGLITGQEALILGLALSLDAMGAGIGAAMIGFSPWLTALCIGCFSSLFLLSGMVAGRRLAGCRWVRKASFLPGALLIVLGFYKMF
jgi:putative sporulation protein YtaF